jgi:hypothetical protein
MSLRGWADSGWLRPHSTSREEIAGLLGIVERDIIEYDAAGTVSPADARELVEFVVGLRESVLRWLREHHSELLDQ